MSDSYTIEDQAIAAADTARALREMPAVWRLALGMDEGGYTAPEIAVALAQIGVNRDVADLINAARRWRDTGARPLAHHIRAGLAVCAPGQPAARPAV
jgi:hypothetical protein